jgi:2-(1,2-epoxy-1,2-dihydrophenyl)acetyl-CoA isomerase
MFLSERIDARRCEALGLVDQMIAGAELRDVAFEHARSLAEDLSQSLGRHE